MTLNYTNATSTPGFYYITTTRENHKYQNFKKKILKCKKVILVDQKMKKSERKDFGKYTIGGGGAQSLHVLRPYIYICMPGHFVSSLCFLIIHKRLSTKNY